MFRTCVSFHKKKIKRWVNFLHTSLMLNLRILRAEGISPWGTLVLTCLQLKFMPLLTTLRVQQFNQRSLPHCPLYPVCTQAVLTASMRPFSFWFRDDSPTSLDLELLVETVLSLRKHICTVRNETFGTAALLRLVKVCI